jgi:hypothetical protein
MATSATTSTTTMAKPTPPCVNRRRKRDMTTRPFPPKGGFVRSGSLGAAPYQRRAQNASMLARRVTALLRPK